MVMAMAYLQSLARARLWLPFIAGFAPITWKSVWVGKCQLGMRVRQPDRELASLALDLNRAASLTLPKLHGSPGFSLARQQLERRMWMAADPSRLCRYSCIRSAVRQLG